MSSTASSVSRAPRPSSLADVLDLILDKGLVVDAYVRISLAGIELLTVDARVVVASVDTYLRFAEAVNRLDITQTEEKGIEALTGRSSQNGSGGDGGGEEGGSGSRKQQRAALGRSRHDEDGAGEKGAGENRRRRPEPARSRRDEAHGAEQGGDDDEHEDDEQDDGGGTGLIGRLAERARFDR